MRVMQPHPTHTVLFIPVCYPYHSSTVSHHPLVPMHVMRPHHAHTVLYNPGYHPSCSPTVPTPVFPHACAVSQHTHTILSLPGYHPRRRPTVPTSVLPHVCGPPCTPTRLTLTYLTLTSSYFIHIPFKILLLVNLACTTTHYNLCPPIFLPAVIRITLHLYLTGYRDLPLAIPLYTLR